MTLRYLTVDPCGNIYEVTNLFDRYANPTKDPVLASSCVIKLGNREWLPQDTTDIPIYTVH